MKRKRTEKQQNGDSSSNSKVAKTDGDQSDLPKTEGDHIDPPKTESDGNDLPKTESDQNNHPKTENGDESSEVPSADLNALDSTPGKLEPELKPEPKAEEVAD